MSDPSTQVDPAVAYPKLRSVLAHLDTLQGRSDLSALAGLLEDLDLNADDLESACSFSDERYQRNVIKASDWYELVVICWNSGQRTPIHDHRGSSCAFRVIKGNATEVRFEVSPSGIILPTETVTLKEGFVAASQDADIHQVANAQPEGGCLINLHCYSPPLRQFHKYTLDSSCADDQVELVTLTAHGPDTGSGCDDG